VRRRAVSSLAPIGILIVAILVVGAVLSLVIFDNATKTTTVTVPSISTLTTTVTIFPASITSTSTVFTTITVPTTTISTTETSGTGTGYAENTTGYANVTTASTSATSSSEVPTGQTATITLPSDVGDNQQLNFSPPALTVAAGTTITFSDQDSSAVHNVDFTSVPSGSTVAQGTTSPNLKDGNSYTVTLTTPGTYTYVCDYHAWMKGTITVTGQADTIALPSDVGENQQLNFSPSTLSVVSGTTITFVDQDSTAVYNVDFMTGPSGATLPSVSSNLKDGDTFQVTLTTPGTYTYVCDYHSWMKGTIVVTGTGTSTTTTSSSTIQTTSSSTSTIASSSSGNHTTVVTMPSGVGENQSLNFSPASITVVVGVNNTIVWTNDDTAVHNVDFQSGPTGATLPPTSINVRNGQSTPPIILTVPGTYTYVCDYHAWMKGTITVIDQADTITLPSGVGDNQQLNFSPSTLSVSPGTTITFVDQDSTAVHNIDFQTGPSGATLPGTSPNLRDGDTYSVTLTTPGTYTYVCDYHAWMKGTITVS
jgi:plastocyanin